MDRLPSLWIARRLLNNMWALDPMLWIYAYLIIGVIWFAFMIIGPIIAAIIITSIFRRKKKGKANS